MTKSKDELKKLNEQIEDLTEEEKVVEAELSRNRVSQLSSYETVANEAKKRMDSCQVNSKNTLFCKVIKLKLSVNLFEKLKRKSAVFDKTPIVIEETKTEIEQLQQLKTKIDQVKNVKQQIQWCKKPDVNDN